jgi:hypothetical protein
VTTVAVPVAVFEPSGLITGLTRTLTGPESDPVGTATAGARNRRTLRQWIGLASM